MAHFVSARLLLPFSVYNIVFFESVGIHLNLLRITTNVFLSEHYLIRSYPRLPNPREMTQPQYLLILVSVLTLCCHSFISVNIPPRYLIVGGSEDLVVPRDNYKTLKIMSALLAAHLTNSIRCNSPPKYQNQEIQPTKKSPFWTKF